MAIYHLELKPIQRAKSRSSTAAAAYRAGEKIADKRTGEIHDFTRKRGVAHSAIVLPGGGAVGDRGEFWNGVERHHRRGDAVTAWECVTSLPSELSEEQRTELASAYAREMADRYGVAIDYSIHRPDRRGDDRNHHVHYLISGCKCSPAGELGKKAETLDPFHCKRRGL